MAVGLNDFIERLKVNQVRTQNMFEVEVECDIPTVQEVFNGITMYATGFQLPDRSQEFAEIGFKGFTLPVPTVMKMGQEHTMTINADVDGNLRRGFLAWAGAVSDPHIKNGPGLFEGDRRFGSSTIRVHLLGYSMNTPIETYVMTGVRIANVGGLQVSNTDSGISTFDVQFRSLYWYIEGIQGDSFQSQFQSGNQTGGSDPKLKDQV